MYTESIESMSNGIRQLVIGCGEVGTAVAGLLDADKCDVNVSAPREQYDVIHVCFPYSTEFCQHVANYQAKFRPSLTVIHSTVPLGTSRACGAVHSPVRGKHPNLQESLKIFVKFFGGARANEAAALFSQCSCACVPDQETTEALKLWDTTIYGVNIALEKTIHEWCKKNNVDFQTVYTYANETYNAGYLAMGNPEFCKYVLKHVPGPVSGHCVKPNGLLLGGWPNDLIQSAGMSEATT